MDLIQNTSCVLATRGPLARCINLGYIDLPENFSAHALLYRQSPRVINSLMAHALPWGGEMTK